MTISHLIIQVSLQNKNFSNICCFPLGATGKRQHGVNWWPSLTHPWNSFKIFVMPRTSRYMFNRKKAMFRTAWIMYWHLGLKNCTHMHTLLWTYCIPENTNKRLDCSCICRKFRWLKDKGITFCNFVILSHLYILPCQYK